MKQVKLTLSLICLLAIAQTTFAQATLSVQGVIKNSDGSAVDNGKYSLTFKLYSVSSGGTAVWSETQNNIQVTGGIYSALLGAATPLDAPFNTTYYLGLAVDGGAELVPRTLLTSSPYALSLIGTGNVFPSSGSVGAGTIAPTAGYQLHTKNASGDGKLLVEGSTAAKLDFKKGANTASITYDGTNINVDNLNLSSYSPATLAVTSKLAVGQANVDASAAFKVAGTSILAGFLDVTVGASMSGGSHWFYGGGGSGSSGSFSGTNLSIRGTGAVHAEVFRATSDRRIKKNFHFSDAATDLSLLVRLQVTDYNYIDAVKSGHTLTKGFIAQELAQVFPQAVNFSTDFIPNTYSLSAKTALAAGKMTISMEKNHGFAVGDEVKLMMPDGEKIVTVAAVPAEKSFLVNWDAPAADKIFVYGKKVEDFHTVDYDRITTLNVSATQELARKVEILEKKLAASEAANTTLKTELTKKENEMKASAEKFDARLRALENKLSN